MEAPAVDRVAFESVSRRRSGLDGPAREENVRAGCSVPASSSEGANAPTGECSPAGLNVNGVIRNGVILADQVKTLDWRACEATVLMSAYGRREHARLLAGTLVNTSCRKTAAIRLRGRGACARRSG